MHYSQVLLKRGSLVCNICIMYYVLYNLGPCLPPVCPDLCPAKPGTQRAWLALCSKNKIFI